MPWKEKSKTGLAKVQSSSTSGDGLGWNEGPGAVARTSENKSAREEEPQRGRWQWSIAGGDGPCQVTMAQLPRGDTGEEASSLLRHFPPGKEGKEGRKQKMAAIKTQRHLFSLFPTSPSPLHPTIFILLLTPWWQPSLPASLIRTASSATTPTLPQDG